MGEHINLKPTRERCCTGFLLLLTICLTACLIGCRKVEKISVSGARYISLAPANTEILYALGLAKHIVGVTEICDYPPDARKKPSIGSFSNPSITRIVSLQPDIIFATGLEQAAIVDNLRKLKLNVHVNHPSNLREFFAAVEEIGQITQTHDKAKLLVSSMKSRIEKIKQRVKKIPQEQRPRIYVEIWHSPAMTAGRGSFVHELIEIAGGRNIAYDIPRAYSYISPEQIIQRNPDYIILCYMNNEKPEDLRKRIGWKNIEAVKKNQIIRDIHPDLTLRPGPRLIDGLEEIHKRLYP